MEVLGADTGYLIKYERRNESSCSDVIVKTTCVQNPNLWLSLHLHQERKAEQAFKAQSKLKTFPLHKWGDLSENNAVGYLYIKTGKIQSWRRKTEKGKSKLLRSL